MTGVVRHAYGPRLYVAGLRVHHGAAGCALALIGLARRNLLLTAIAGAMVIDDLADFPWRDCDNHPVGSARSRLDLRDRAQARRLRPNDQVPPKPYAAFPGCGAPG